MLTKEMQAGRYGKGKAAALPKMKESILQKQCENYLCIRGLQYIRVPDTLYRATFASNRIPLHLKRLISSYIKGLPDITVLYTSGHYSCIELKSAAGKQSLAQKKFERSIGSDNYHLVRTFQEFVKIINLGIDKQPK